MKMRKDLRIMKTCIDRGLCKMWISTLEIFFIGVSSQICISLKGYASYYCACRHMCHHFWDDEGSKKAEIASWGWILPSVWTLLLCYKANVIDVANNPFVTPSRFAHGYKVPHTCTNLFSTYYMHATIPGQYTILHVNLNEVEFNNGWTNFWLLWRWNEGRMC